MSWSTGQLSHANTTGGQIFHPAQMRSGACSPTPMPTASSPMLPRPAHLHLKLFCIHITTGATTVWCSVSAWSSSTQYSDRASDGSPDEGGTWSLVVTWAMDIDTVPCCRKAMDPDIVFLGGSTGLGQISPWPQVTVQASHTRLFFIAFESAIPPRFIVHKLLCFSFSPISPPHPCSCTPQPMLVQQWASHPSVSLRPDCLYLGPRFLPSWEATRKSVFFFFKEFLFFKNFMHAA